MSNVPPSDDADATGTYRSAEPNAPRPRDLMADPRDLAAEAPPASLSGAPFDPFVPPTAAGPAGAEPAANQTAPLKETPAFELAHASPGVLRRLAGSRLVRMPVVVAGLTCLLVTLAFAMTRPQRAALASDGPPTEEPEELPLVAFAPDDPYTFRGLDIHPDRMFASYFGGAFLTAADQDSTSAAAHRDFRYRMEMYRRAYGIDDNFTISVYDDRTGERLETSSLADLRAQYNVTGRGDWDAVDAARRGEAGRLRTKWLAMGIPVEALTVRWGRANQTREARERDVPFVAYELQLARRLGLSALATEIGTVETFNQDQLVSSAGARSRYQMMPDIMQMFDVEQYALPVVTGGTVAVREELHPLLAMEPSMMLLRGYANAVGHELPGISAYHTGPGNLFILYQAYIRSRAADPPTNGHVSEAYMWGVTDGFETVDAQSSFGPESRAYVMKAYGALRATEDEVIEPSETYRAERVHLRREATVSLSRLLTLLAAAPNLDWATAGDRPSLYARFRALNPHIALPAAPTADSAEVPASGDVRFTATADGKPVRFFLPAGAAEHLRRGGFDFFAEVAPFNERTFAVEASDVTRADRAYDALVEDIGRFGFSTANKARLDALVSQMQALAAAEPGSRYRQTQARIIRIHQSVWSTRGFRDLASTVDTFMSYLPARRRAAEQGGVAADSTAVAPGG